MNIKRNIGDFWGFVSPFQGTNGSIRDGEAHLCLSLSIQIRTDGKKKTQPVPGSLCVTSLGWSSWSGLVDVVEVWTLKGMQIGQPNRPA